MADNVNTNVIGVSNDLSGGAANSNKNPLIPKMFMGPAKKNTKKKAPKVAGNKRLPRRLKKGM